MQPQEWDAQGNPISAGGGIAPTEWDASGKPISAVPATDTRSLYQKAKDNFNAATQGSSPGEYSRNPLLAGSKDTGAALGDFVRAIAHPIRTIDAMTSTPEPIFAAAAHFAGNDEPLNTLKSMPTPNAVRSLAQMGIGALAGEGLGEVASRVSPALRGATSRALLLGKTPAEAYESALKPSTAVTQLEREQAVQTGLQNSIPVSKGGVEKLTAQIEDLNQKIKNTIDADPNRPIDPNKAATRANSARARFQTQVNKQQDLNAIEASRQQFLDEQGRTAAVPPKPTGLLDSQGNPIMTKGAPAQPAPPMGAADAQAMKQGTYRVLRGKFGEQGSAAVEAQKALARGLKEEIANQFPEISKLNATESKLLDLQPILERAVNRISNHQLIGIGTPVAGAAADAVAGPGVGRAAMVLKAVLDNPNVKSRLAISLSKGGKIPYAQALARVAAYSSALSASAPDSRENPSP